MENTLKFIQITATRSDQVAQLFGLTVEGAVYRFDYYLNTWFPLPMTKNKGI